MHHVSHSTVKHNFQFDSFTSFTASANERILWIRWGTKTRCIRCIVNATQYRVTNSPFVLHECRLFIIINQQLKLHECGRILSLRWCHCKYCNFTKSAVNGLITWKMSLRSPCLLQFFFVFRFMHAKFNCKIKLKKQTASRIGTCVLRKHCHSDGLNRSIRSHHIYYNERQFESAKG